MQEGEVGGKCRKSGRAGKTGKQGNRSWDA